jgi:molybdopterin molybdotransferase
MEEKGSLMEIDQARETIRAKLAVRAEVSLPLEGCLGRITARSLVTAFDSPGFDQSARDGYALASVQHGPHPLLKPGKAVPASHHPLGASRVATGFPIPDWAVCVVPQENCHLADGSVTVHTDYPLEKELHIRRRGGSFVAGTEVMPKGALVTPGLIALAASCGCGELPVRAPVTALHIATGSELITTSAKPKFGQVFDSNGPMMAALLAERRIAYQRLMTGDDADLLSRTLKDFSGDLLLISGGSGPGEQDHTVRSLEKSGFHIHICGVRSRPGKPLIFATRGDQAAFGLPGNPLSQWVCFHVFVQTALDRWNDLPLAGFISAYCENWRQPKGDGRPSWTPATLNYAQGRACVDPLPWQHSGDLLPLARATALLFGEPDHATKLIPTMLTQHQPDLL